MSPRLPRRELPDPYKVSIVCDSLGPSAHRLTTWALTYPRFVHAELMTHRVFSRNSASSRAIPSEKMRAIVRDHPALPIFWGKNQSGMQAREELSDEVPPLTLAEAFSVSDEYIANRCSPRREVQRLWLEARNVMLEYSDKLAALGLHKQLCNRLTEPWMPITVLVSATNFGNWFHLRDHKDAQPELQVIATEMHYQYLETTPRKLYAGEWHLPYIREEDRSDETLLLAIEEHRVTGQVVSSDDILRKVSVGRCARVSYLTHEGIRDLRQDISLHDKLAATTQTEDPGHFSPFEHPAQALARPERIGNFVGFRQYRKDFANEAGPEFVA